MKPDTKHNYLGVFFYDCKWEDVSRCCICPPDLAYRWHKKDEEDEWDNILVLWKEDEAPDEKPRVRVYLGSIMAALALLFSSRHGTRLAYNRLVNLRHRDGEHVSAVDFHLWKSTFTSCNFRLSDIRSIDELELSGTPETLTAPDACYDAALTEWMELVYARMNRLLDSIHDAESYALFKPMLDSWFRYFCEYPEPDIEQRVNDLESSPWYPGAESG